jgi:two-component system, chemotaxis family, chemotaxis protein CheY
MKSTETLLRKLDDPALSYDEQVQRRCQVAAEFEQRGQYEAARDALGELWQGVGIRPVLERLTELTAAEVLLRAGTLSGWFGSVHQLKDAQEAAKNLISESSNLFQALGETIKAIAAQSELGYCYWREGAYDDACIIYTEALKELNDKDKELKADILLRLAIVEECNGKCNDALHRLTDAAPIFEGYANHALKGKFHNELGAVLTILSKPEHRQDYADRAIIEYTEAAYHFEHAGHTSYRARAENNLGVLLYNSGHFAKAREHLNHARRLFLDLQDDGSVAQVDETLARVILAEGKPHVAARIIEGAVQTLSKGGEQGVLAEALTTQGVVLARLHDLGASQSKLRRAADLAEQAGAVEEAGRALLALIEEHAEWLAEHELVVTYERADDLLKATQDAETIARLRACAHRVIAACDAVLPDKSAISRENFWANFSLAKRVRAYEARYIRRALIEAQGSVSRAARLLGLKHHASLAALLQRRHRSLAHLRTPPEKRKRKSARVRGPRHTAKALGQGLSIGRVLYVEDNRVLAEVVKDTLELEGWSVETLGEGSAALRRLASETQYDLLILDHELPELTGLELAREARRLSHRRQLPIIMLTGNDVSGEATRLGVNACRLKPEGLETLVETIEQLFNPDSKD